MKNTRKIFVIDTNVILFDPNALDRLGGGNDLVIPIVVIEEIDRFKRDMGENGRHARQFSRRMDELRGSGDLRKGVRLKNGALLTVLLGEAESISALASTPDNKILGFALGFQRERSDQTVIILTKDVNLRIKADALGLRAEDYEPESVAPEELYTGVRTVSVAPNLVDDFYINRKVELEGDFKPNQYLIIKDEFNPAHTAMGRYSKELECVVPIVKPAEGLWGIFPKNAEQAFAIDALLNDDIKLVSLVGKAGTGKTLLAIAAGLAKTVDQGVFTRLLVSRPVFPLGKDIGFLPGTVEEKLNPWMQPIYDNVDFLFGSTGGKGQARAGKGCQELMNQGLLQIEPLTYIRGRSIPKQYLIVDESQNLTPHEIKTIVTRAGDDTKIVLTGDSFQIDNPYVDAANNGLVYLVDRFKDEDISAHITLTKGERSRLSELASNLL
ncbi:MAG: hypothetical protein RJB66_37 [Pseudomonadota bacterium]|jgi:PhoH-like ATPase